MSMEDDMRKVLSMKGPNRAPIDTPEVKELLDFADSKNVRLVWLKSESGGWGVAGMWQHPGSEECTAFAPQENPAGMTRALQRYFAGH